MTSSAQPLKICIVTGQIVGPLQQGGIGTATTGLAILLASAGHQVTVLFTRGYQMSASRIRHWSAVYRDKGITFTPLDARCLSAVRGPMASLEYPVPPAILNYLLAEHFDVVHLNDLEGEGCLAVAARKCGLAFADTVFVTGLHSPTQWIETLNREPSPHNVAVAMDAAERFQIRNSDALWSPSRYLLDWIALRDFALPAVSEVQQYVLPPLPQRTVPPDLQTPRQKVTNLVFFGRIEERKGIFTFLDALDLIKDQLKSSGVKVSFLGSQTIINGVASADLIRSRGAYWPFEIDVMGSLPHREALAFLAARDKLAVMASPEDNSPCTIYEAMELGIPFIAASGGGIPELINADHQTNVLFQPEAASLANCLRHALAAPPPVPQPVHSQDEIKSQWRARHEPDGWIGLKRNRQSADPAPMIKFGILIEDSGSNDALARTLASLASASQPAFVAIVSTRSTPRAANVPVLTPSTLAAHLSAQGPAALLCLTAGFELESAKLDHLGASASRFPSAVLLPSVTLRGEPAAAPPLSPALAYMHGPAQTGCMLIGADLAARLLKPETGSYTSGSDGPFGGLADRAIATLAEIIPYPSTIGSIVPSAIVAARPLPSAARLRHYRNLPPDQLEKIAAYTQSCAKLSWKPSGRKFWLRLIASPLGPLAPWILEAGRRLSLTKR